MVYWLVCLIVVYMFGFVCDLGFANSLGLSC